MEVYPSELLTSPPQNAKRLVVHLASRCLHRDAKSRKQVNENNTIEKIPFQNTKRTPTTTPIEQKESNPKHEEFPEMAKKHRPAQGSGKGKKKQGIQVEVAGWKPTNHELWGIKLGKKEMRVMKLFKATENCARKLRDAYVEMMMAMASSRGASSLRGIGLVNHSLAGGALLYPDHSS